MNKKEREHWLKTGEYPGNNNPKAIPKKPTTPKPKPQPKPDNKTTTSTKTETSTADKLGALSKIAAQLGGSGLQGVSPSATPVGEGAPGSIQYTKLDQEVDASQDKIRKQIERLR